MGMEKGIINISIDAPTSEMKTLESQLIADETFYDDCESEVYENRMQMTAGYIRGTADILETWKRENPHWDITCKMHIYGWGTQSVHLWENGNEHDYELEDIDLKDMDPICEELVEDWGLEEEIEELLE